VRKDIKKTTAETLYDNLQLPKAVLEEILKERAIGKTVSNGFVRNALQELGEAENLLKNIIHGKGQI